MRKTLPNIINLRSLREQTEQYIEAVQSGKSFTVIRKSQPIFKIVPIDIWGDDGYWENVIDFTQINQRGISVNDLLKGLANIQ